MKFEDLEFAITELFEFRKKAVSPPSSPEEQEELTLLNLLTTDQTMKTWWPDKDWLDYRMRGSFRIRFGRGHFERSK